MIILAGTVRVARGRKADAIPHMQRMVAATRAEPGCISYAFSFDVVDDHLVRIFEVYEDQAAVDFHRNAAHFAEWRAGWPAAGIGERDMTLYTISASQKV